MRRNRVLILFAVVFAMSTAVIWLGSVLAAATIVNNNGLTVSEAGSRAITDTLLLANDPDAPGAILTYTLVTTPENGSLILNGNTTEPLTPTSQFTQSDIDSSALVYMHDDSETLSDGFDFTVETSTTITNDTFLITITPVFDQIPIVSNQEFNVDENSSVGVSVGTILATDSDAGDALTYSILDGNTGTAFEVGSINTTDAAITVANTAPLDFETNQSITFTVQVEDMGTLTDTAVITVNINDINEAPIITGTTFSIPENSANDFSVGTVITSDVDANDTFTYTITASDPVAAFGIGSGDGQITVTDTTQLDFETTPTFTLTVQVEDSGGLTDSGSYIIDLTDVNEPPVVDTVTFSVNENSPNGTAVGTPVTATDPDEGASLTFSILDGNTDNIFDIGDSSGQITVIDNTLLNFEAQGATPHYPLTIQASDGSLTGTAIININVLDVNEVPTVNDATFSVEENSPIGTSVGTVTATDPEGDVTFEIISGNTSSAFAINSTSGEITVNASTPLNFEVTPTFNLTVRVTDNGSPTSNPLTDTASITINLTNKNEMPTVNDATFFIVEDSQNGAVVGTVSASDPDAGDNLTFSITGGNSGTPFAINPSSGQITVNDSTKLNADTTPTYNLTVQVLDSGNLPDTATITINVTALPITYIYLPVMLNNYPPIEPNNNCSQAYGIGSGRDYEFTADDVEDWYAITLTSPGNLIVVLSSFEPAQGQLIVYGGICGSLTLLGNNGTPNTPDKTLNLGTRPAGTYYIRIYSAPVTNTPYTLRVNVN